MRALTVLVTGVLLAGAVSACGSDSGGGDSPPESGAAADPGTTGTAAARKVTLNSNAKGGKPVHLAIFYAFTANGFLQACGEGSKSVAKARGATVDTFDAKFDPQAQYNQIQDAISSKKYDAFVIYPLDSVGIVPAVEDAVAAGIKVAGACGFPIGKDLATLEPQVPGQVGMAYLPYDKWAEGRAAIVVEACQDVDPCEVADLVGCDKCPTDAYASQVLKDTTKQHPNIKIVARAGTQFQEGPALSATQNILQAHPNLKVVIAPAPAAATGALKAIDDAGKTGEIKVGAAGGSIEGIADVESGDQYGEVLQLPYDEGMYAADMVIRAVRGEKLFKAAVNPNDLAGLPLYVTQKNKAELKGFKGQWHQ